MNIDNLNKFNNKRKLDEQSIYSLSVEALHEIEQKYNKQFNNKGEKLVKFLINLSETINNTLICLNIDKELKTRLLTNSRLNLIAESEVLKSIIDDIHEFSIKNPDFKFIKFTEIHYVIGLNHVKKSEIIIIF
jgi:hypothetical protein